MCSSYQGPSRSPAGRPAAAKIAATNGPYIVSLSSSAGDGTSAASRMSATVLLPDPGGPATTHAGAGALITSQDRRSAYLAVSGQGGHSSSPSKRRPSGPSDAGSPRCSSMRRGSPGKASPSGGEPVDHD